MAKVSYDPKCEELARYFLMGEADRTEELVRELAGVIQRAIEDWWAEPRPERKADAADATQH
jgi:hypothetical protein